MSVAIVVGDRVPAWIAWLVESLRRSPAFEVVVATTAGGADRGETRGFRLYERADARLFRGQVRNALATANLDETPRRLRDLPPCDVVVAAVPLAAAEPPPRARLGVWSVSFLDRHAQENLPLLFWETAAGGLYETRLEAALAPGDRRLLYSSVGAADRASLARTRSRALWKAAGAILRELEAAARDDGRVAGKPRAPARDTSRGRRRASSGAVLRHAWAAGAGLLARRLGNAASGEIWFLGIRARAEAPVPEIAATPPPFHPLRPPEGHAYADPFVFDHDGSTFVFFEDYDFESRRASIACVELDGEGRPKGAPATVLDPPYHVSYPFVFRRDGEVFMIPESSADRTVTLYRAESFPWRWSASQTLLDDIEAVDPTLVVHDGRFWLFVGVATPGASLNDELHVYVADDLAGPWAPHPQNPVVADVRRARPAGRIFVRDGRLVRPGQDCERAYGFAVVFNVIDVLSETEYRETPVARLDPTWGARLTATHTYTFSDTVEAVDGRRRLLRRFPR